MPTPPKKRMSPQEWYKINVAEGNVLSTDYPDLEKQLAMGKYPTFYNPKQFKKSPDGGFINLQNPNATDGDPDYRSPYIKYESPGVVGELNRLRPAVEPAAGHKSMQFSPYNNTNPNTGVITDPKTGKEVEPVVEQYRKGGLVAACYDEGGIVLTPEELAAKEARKQKNSQIATGVAGLANTVADFGATEIDSNNVANEQGQVNATQSAWSSGLRAAGKGAVAGAAIGSVIPVVGTAAGAVIGGGIAGTIGFIKGKNNAEAQNRDNMAEYEAEEEQKKMLARGNRLLAAESRFGYAAGGKVKGPGGPKDDKVPAMVEDGSYIIPAENAGIAAMLREKLLGQHGNKKAPLNTGDVPVKLSNGEHKFSPEEVDVLEARGVNLDALAPLAENTMSEGYAKGGRVGEDKFEAVRKDAEAELKKAYPGKDVKVIYKGEERSLDEQEAAFKKGSSTTKIGLHQVGGARDFNIIIDGRVVGNSGNDLELYKDFVWKNAKKHGLHHLDEKGFGSTDPYHIGLVEETGDGTAFKRLVEKHPEIAETTAYKETLRKVKEIKSKNPKDTTFDNFLKSEEVIKKKEPKNSDFDQSFSDNLRAGASKGLVESVKQQQAGPRVIEMNDAIRRQLDSGEEPSGGERVVSQVDNVPVSRRAPKVVERDDAWVRQIDAMEDAESRKGELVPKSAIAGELKEKYLVDPKTVPSASELYKKSTTVDPNTIPSADELYSKPGAGLVESVNQLPSIQARSLPVQEAEIRTQPIQDLSQPEPVPTQRRSADWAGIASTVANYAAPALQSYLGNKMLQEAGPRPVDKIDPDYLASIDAAKRNLNMAEANAKFGFSAEEQALINQQNAAATNQGRAAARNYSGGSAANAFNMELGAINDGYTRDLTSRVQDKNLKFQKQGIAMNTRAYVDNLIQGKTEMNRRLFNDENTAWLQKQEAGGNLMNAGMTGLVGAARYDAELEAAKKRALKYGQ